MPEYLSPGVYIEELDGPQPIEGVSTSTTGAVGVTARGPVDGKPILVTSFSEFQRTFGDFLEPPAPALRDRWADPTNPEGGQWWLFPLSIKGFFDNGGQRCYVKRVFSSKAKPSALDLGQGLVSEVDRDVPATAKSVRLRHLYGLDVGTQATLLRDGQNLGLFQVQSYEPTTREVVFDKAFGQSLKTDRDYFVIAAITSGAANTTLPLRARSPGVWGDDIRVRARPTSGGTFALRFSAALADPEAAHQVTQTTFTYTWSISVDNAGTLANGDQIFIAGSEYVITSAPAANAFNLEPADPNATYADVVAANAALAVGTLVVRSTAPQLTAKFESGTVTPGTWTVTLDDVTNFANANHVAIDGEEYTLGNGNAAAKTFDIAPVNPGGELGLLFPAGTTVRRLRRANSIGETNLSVTGASGLYVGALVEFDTGTTKEVLSVDALPGGDAVSFTPATTLQYFEGASLRVIELEILATYGSTTERITNLPFTNGGQDLVADINKRSTLLWAQSPGPGFSASDLAAFPITPNSTWQALAGGDDAYASLTADDFVGVDGGSGARTGIQALEDIDDISISIVPNIWSEAVHGALIEQAESMRYRFAIIDPPDELSIGAIQDFRAGYDTKYAALYYPWLVVRDPSVQADVHVAPSGHLAGIYARVDVERGVHKAPANEVIRGINLLPRQGLAADVNKREQDVLNPIAINALRFFPDRGHRVWGARVLTDLSEWKYVNVRRLFIYLEHSIDKGTQWVVFEPNDEPLWARVRQSVGNFLESAWRSGMLMGTKAEEAFFVKVDRTTMSQDDLDNGRLIVLVGIAPVKPAEFVIFRIQQKTIDQQAP